MGTAEPHRNAESLGGAECNIGSDLPRRGDQGQCQQIGSDRDQGTTLMSLLNEFRPVGDTAAGTGNLRDHSEEFALGQTVAQIGGDDLDAQRFGAGGQHGGGLGEQIGVDGQPVRRAAGSAVHQSHRLGGRGALIQHGGACQIQTGELGDHGLEIQQRLQPALTDLRLIRRVGGVPRRILQDVAQQYRRGQGVVVALADHRHGHGIGIGQRPEFGQRLVFGDRRGQCLQSRCTSLVGEHIEDSGRQRLGREFVERVHPDHTEHGGQRLGVETDMAGDKAGIGVIRIEFRHRHSVTRGRTQPSAWRPLPLSLVPERFSASPGDPGRRTFPHGRATARGHHFPEASCLVAVLVPERLTERCCSFGVRDWRPRNSPARGRCMSESNGRRGLSGDRRGQPILRSRLLRLEANSSSGAAIDSPPSARSPGKSAIAPVSSRIAPLTAIPNTP